MNEKLFQFIWRFQYCNTNNLKTITGENITIINRGTYNTNQGPDFLNAKIKIGETILVGNIELHTLSSDWQKHQHQTDENYQNIILHIVWKHNIKGDTIFNYPVLELQTFVSKILLDKYNSLMLQNSFIPCQNQIANISYLQFNNWKDRLLIERLETKTIKILEKLITNQNNWEETFWQILASNFGIKTNAEAFETIAINTPVLVLAKNKLSLHKIESILMGQAGLLEATFTDAYAIMLQNEYSFLKQKYNLTQSPIKAAFLRMRPYNFPTLRLSQLAQLIFKSNKLFSVVLNCKTFKEVIDLFSVSANDYWLYHYKLDDDATSLKEKNLGIDMQHNILINTIVPIVFAYGIYYKNEDFKNKAILWLESIPAEVNNITKGFRTVEIKSKTAADSQSLIQLKNYYCNYKKCLDCAVGNSILKKDI